MPDAPAIATPVGFEDARAQFPVLERIAYLNAGTFGPLARSTVDVLQREIAHDLDEGRSGMAYFERALGLRESVRERLRVAAPSYFGQTGYELDGTFTPRPGAARFDPNWISAAALAALVTALDGRPEWAFTHAAAVADRCRDRLVAALDS